MRDALKQMLIRTPLEQPALRLRSLLKRPKQWRHPELAEIYLEDQRGDEAMGRLIRRDSNCIDVGCHIGSVLSQMLRLAPEGRHTAFEPTPEKVARLRRKFPEVDVQQLALSDTEGEATFYVDESRSGFSGLRLNHEVGQAREIKVGMVRLDGLRLTADKIDFMKVDVEGAELGVLRGAQGLLERDRPAILFECTLDGLSGFDLGPADVYAYLHEDVDYEIFLFKDFLAGREPLSADRFDQAHRYPFAAFNFLALPREGRPG